MPAAQGTGPRPVSRGAAAGTLSSPGPGAAGESPLCACVVLTRAVAMATAWRSPIGCRAGAGVVLTGDVAMATPGWQLIGSRAGTVSLGGPARRAGTAFRL